MIRSLAAVTAIVLSAGCGESVSPAERAAPVSIFAAASTSVVLDDALATRIDLPFRTSYGSTSGLARQIARGAPADLFVSADAKWIERLREKGHLSGVPVDLFSNRIVVVAPAGADLGSPSPGGLSELAARLAPGDRVAIADEGVPAGEYARQALAALGEEESFRGHLVALSDARAVARAVAAGEVVAGFVYATDVQEPGLRSLFALPTESHDAIVYQAAVVNRPEVHERAFDALSAVGEPGVRAAFAEAGFILEGADGR